MNNKLTHFQRENNNLIASSSVNISLQLLSIYNKYYHWQKFYWIRHEACILGNDMQNKNIYNSEITFPIISCFCFLLVILWESIKWLWKKWNLHFECKHFCYWSIICYNGCSRHMKNGRDYFSEISREQNSNETTKFSGIVSLAFKDLELVSKTLF